MAHLPLFSGVLGGSSGHFTTVIRVLGGWPNSETGGGRRGWPNSETGGGRVNTGITRLVVSLLR